MRRFTFIVAAALALAACGALTSSEIEGKWHLTSGEFDGHAITMVDGRDISLVLSDEGFEGNSACNSYGGAYEFDSGSFKVLSDDWTEEGCPTRELEDSEREYRAALHDVDSARLVDGHLVLSGAMAKLTFEPMAKEPPTASESPADNVALFGLDVFGSWELISGEADGEPIPMVASHPITIEISENGVGGTAACNLYGGVPGAGGFSVTEMACSPQEVMDSESAYLAALARITDSGAGGQLVLTGDGVELVFRPLEPIEASDLLGTVWVLDGLIQGDAVTSPVAGTRATLELFSDGSFIGDTGCRTIAGSYVVSGTEVVFTSWGAEGECPAELSEQDSRVISALEGGFRVEIEEDRMTTWVAGDEGLVYRAEG